MYRLYIDSSNRNLTIIVTDKKKVLVSYQKDSFQKQTELAVTTINQLLSKINLKLRNITELVVTIGPGSYTGIRVAVSFAKTLKVLYPKLVIYCLNTLLLQAGLNKAISILSAYSGKSYLAVYEQGKEIIKPQLVTETGKVGIISDLPEFQVIQDFDNVNSINNFLSLENQLIKIKDINDLQPLYIGDNFKVFN